MKGFVVGFRFRGRGEFFGTGNRWPRRGQQASGSGLEVHPDPVPPDLPVAGAVQPQHAAVSSSRPVAGRFGGKHSIAQALKRFGRRLKDLGSTDTVNPGAVTPDAALAAQAAQRSVDRARRRTDGQRLAPEQRSSSRLGEQGLDGGQGSIRGCPAPGRALVVRSDAHRASLRTARRRRHTVRMIVHVHDGHRDMVRVRPREVLHQCRLAGASLVVEEAMAITASSGWAPERGGLESQTDRGSRHRIDPRTWNPANW